MCVSGGAGRRELPLGSLRMRAPDCTGRSLSRAHENLPAITLARKPLNSCALQFASKSFFTILGVATKIRFVTPPNVNVKDHRKTSHFSLAESNRSKGP